MKDLVQDRSTELSDLIFQIAPIGILLAKENGKVLLCNPFLQNLFGISTKDLQSLSIVKYKIFQRTGIAKKFKEAISKNLPVVSECAYSTHEKKFYLEYYFIPFKDQSSNKLTIQGIIVDITKRRSLENEVRKISEYYQKILSSMSPLATIDNGFKVKYCNEQFKTSFSNEKRSLLGENFFDVVGFAPEDVHNLKKKLSIDRKIQNQEFISKGRTYGYSIFSLEEEYGVILKELTKTRELERKVEDLYSQLLKSQEKERQKIAADLHDSIGQTILAAKINLQAYAYSKSEEGLKNSLDLIDRSSEELREIYTNLYPNTLRDLGLESAIRSFVRNLIQEKKCKIEFYFNLKKKIPHELEVNLFRVIQEIFTNIVKHSKATNVEFRITQNKTKSISLYVKDNGIGFLYDKSKVKPRGFGLENLKLRISDLKGSIELNTGKGEGTEYKILVPIS